MKKIILILVLIVAIAPNFTLAQTTIPNPTGVNIIAGREQTTINWTNPTDPTFSGVIVFTSTIPIEDYFTYQAVEGLCDKIYEGNDETVVANNLAPNLPYYFIVFAKDNQGNYSKAVVLERKENLANEGSIVKAEEQNTIIETNNTGANTAENSARASNGTLAGASSAIVNEISFEEAEIVYNYNQRIETPQDPETNRLSLFIIVKSPHDLSDQDKFAISYFIDQGTPTTILLGSGERTGVLNSYLSVFEKLPTDELEWQDVIKIANGRWPNQRNTEAEEIAANETFSRIYQRPANINNAFDNAAVTVIAYGLRPAERNLESEKAAIKIYESIFDKAPVEAYEWDMVRAIAYSGAIR